MIASLPNSSVCSHVSATPHIVVNTTNDRMNNPYGSIPVPTTVVHTTAVAQPPVGIPMPYSPVGQAIDTPHMDTNALDGDSLSSTNLKKI